MKDDFKIVSGVLEKYVGTDSKVVIPDGVKIIKYGAFFNNKNIKSVKIPDSVIIVEARAFNNCISLLSVSIPDSIIEIQYCAFENCKSLTSITIPSRLSKISNSTFYGCTSLKHITIPDSVTEICKRAFYSCTSLISLNIPNSVTTIGESAFSVCTSLTSVIIPDSVKIIEKKAFKFCENLISVIVPESVTSIYEDVFSPNTVIVCRENSYTHYYCLNYRYSYIFDYQFETFNGVIIQRSQMLPSPFFADEDMPFVFISYSHKDRNIVLPIIKGFYEEGWKIWYDEGLTVGDKYDETLEEHIKNCSAFLLFITNNSLQSMYVQENEIPWAIKYGKPIIKCIIDKEADYSIKNDNVVATVSSSAVTSVFDSIDGLSKGETRKAKGVFVLVKPEFREPMSGIGYAYCIYTKTFKSKVKSIIIEARKNGCNIFDANENGENEDNLNNCSCLIVFIDKAFLADERLKKLLIKEYSRGKEIAICQLEELNDEDFPDGLKDLCKIQRLNFAFEITKDIKTQLLRYLQKMGCRNIAVIPGFEYKMTDDGIVITRYIGMESSPKIENEYGGVPVVGIGNNAFNNCVYIKTVVIPDNVTMIDNEAFSGCTNLVSVTIPNCVQKIGRKVFYNCTLLTSINLPNGIKKIEDFTFEFFNGLTSLRIPESVETIGVSAFEDCRNLTSVTIPDSVTNIMSSAFKRCGNLTSIALPNSVTKIGDAVFEDCYRLNSIAIPNSITELGSLAFANCKLTSVIIPDSLKIIKEKAFLLCEELQSISISDGVIIIDDEAFSGCTKLVSVIIPDSVKYIGEGAFYNCKSLTSIRIPEEVTKIGDGAFWGCSDLTIYGKEGSYVCQYAEENCIPFSVL